MGEKIAVGRTPAAQLKAIMFTTGSLLWNYIMSDFELLASYKTHPDHYQKFRTVDIFSQWAKMYPMLFDRDDLRIANNQAKMGYHFYEWLAAVLIYHSFGFYSLVEQYQFKNHHNKMEKLARLTNSELIEFMRSHPDFGNVQCPDLLVYEPDYSDWFFCEVKGPKDRLRESQVEFFEALKSLSSKPIKVVEFQNMPHREKKTYR